MKVLFFESCLLYFLKTYVGSHMHHITDQDLILTLIHINLAIQPVSQIISVEKPSIIFRQVAVHHFSYEFKLKLRYVFTALLRESFQGMANHGDGPRPDVPTRSDSADRAEHDHEFWGFPLNYRLNISEMKCG